MIKSCLRKSAIINGNTIKILALIFMTIDHIGVMLFPYIKILRIIGRLSFPLFAFMIAEGCIYTKNKLKHFLMIFILGIVCQIVFYIVDGDIYQGILITFSLSILIIYSIDYAIKSNKFINFLLPMFTITVVALLNYVLPLAFSKGAFYFDYGFSGTMLAVLIYLPKGKWLKILFAFIGLIFVSLEAQWNTQWWSLLSLIILMFYSGQKGKLNLKYLFYVYYPLHFAIIYAISFLL